MIGRLIWGLLAASLIFSCENSSAQVASTPKPKGKGKFWGKVIDWKNRKPISDFQVDVFGHEGAEVQKDPLVPGRFIVNGLRAREFFSLGITSPGYLGSDSGDLSLESEDKPPVEKEFVLDVGSTIRGRVVERETSKPLGKVSLQLKSIRPVYRKDGLHFVENACTAADGTFSFEKVVPGMTFLRFNPCSPLAWVQRNLEVANGSVLDLGDVVLEPGVTLKGKLLETPGDKPVSNTQVQISMLSDSAKLVKTAADGSFYAEGLVASSSEVSIPAYGFSYNVDLKKGQTNEVVLHIGRCSLNGQVLKRGQPAPGALVSLCSEQERERSLRADREGKFRFEAIRPGKATVRITCTASPRGYGVDWAQTNLREVVEFDDEQVTSRTFQLPWARIPGRVVDSSGKPAASQFARVKVRPTNLNLLYHGEFRVRDDGTFLIEGLSGGEYKIEVDDPDLGWATTNVSVPANGDAQEVILKPEKHGRK